MTAPEWNDVRIILFDWNGTLVADLDRACRALGVVMADRGLPSLGVEGFRQSFRLPLSSWLSELGFAGDDLKTAEDDWNREMRSRPVVLQPGARELMTWLTEAGMAVGVVSAASARSVESDLQETGLDDLVGLVIGDSDDKVEALMDVTDGNSGTAVYVGDVEYDIEAGRAAGLLTVGFAGGYRPRAALEEVHPDALIDDLGELAGLLGVN